MRRHVVVLAAALSSVLPVAVPAAANPPERAPRPLTAGAEAYWVASSGAEHYLHVAVGVGADGTTELMADRYDVTPVRCADGSEDWRMVTWMGGWVRPSAPGVVIDKRLMWARVDETIDLSGTAGGVCGAEPPVLPDRLAAPVTLDLTATSPAIHSLRVNRRHAGGKPESTLEHITLRLAEGTVGLAGRTHATTSGDVTRYASGLGDGPLLATASLGGLTLQGGRPERYLDRASGRYTSGEVRSGPSAEATAGAELVDESGVNAATTAGEPPVMYAGRHRVVVVACDGELATVETFWDAMGEADVRIARSLRSASVSARLPLRVERINACTGTDVVRTRPGVPLSLRVTADSRPHRSTNVEFDHEGGWTTTRLTGSSLSRDGTGSYSIGRFTTGFDIGGVLRWNRTISSRTQRM